MKTDGERNRRCTSTCGSASHCRWTTSARRGERRHDPTCSTAFSGSRAATAGRAATRAGRKLLRAVAVGRGDVSEAEVRRQRLHVRSRACERRGELWSYQGVKAGGSASRTRTAVRRPVLVRSWNLYHGNTSRRGVVPSSTRWSGLPPSTIPTCSACRRCRRGRSASHGRRPRGPAGARPAPDHRAARARVDRAKPRSLSLGVLRAGERHPHGPRLRLLDHRCCR